jgi:hypothetical protein
LSSDGIEYPLSLNSVPRQDQVAVVMKTAHDEIDKTEKHNFLAVHRISCACGLAFGCALSPTALVTREEHPWR